MHPVLRFSAAAIALVGLCSAAHAGDRLSVGFGFGYKIDANQLGETITTDGLDSAAPRIQVLPGFEGAGDPVPELAFLDQSVIVPENTLVALEGLGQISDLKQGGALVAFDLAINLRYDFLDFLFARIGFNYNFRGLGGETSWKSPYGDHLQKWDYQAMAIPLHVGVNVPVQEGRFNVYAGIGAAWASGGFELQIKAPAGWYYAAANAADLGGSPFGNDPETGALAPGRVGEVDEKAAIEGSAIGLGYILGVDGEIIEDLNLVVEFETQYVAKMSEAVDLSDPDAVQVFGAPKLAYPAIPGGQIIRIGLKYTFLHL